MRNVDKVLLITGSGRGIGAAIAVEAARRGYAVCINYSENRSSAEAVCARIQDDGGTAIVVHADISQEDKVVAMFEECDQKLGKLTHLVNNAAIILPRGRVEDCSGEKLERTFGVNVIGPFICAREAIRRMSARHGGNGGAIVNISSVSARLGGAGRTVQYAASKNAINAFTWGLAREVAAEQIRVNAVAPGVVDTEMNAGTGVENLLPQIPMGRIGRADEIAKAVLWLLSDEASYVTGALLTASGGR